jgi:hypothetical protein
MMTLSKLATIVLLAVQASSELEISEECRLETEPFLTEPNLAVAQSIVFEDYTESFNSKCDLGFGSIGCSVKFEGDQRTYRALCEGQGGQLYKRPAVLNCLLGTVEYDLGYIPTCVGSSCNITNVEPGDVVTAQVETFLNNLTIVGCEADASAAVGDRWSVYSGFSVATMVPMFLLAGVSALF